MQYIAGQNTPAERIPQVHEPANRSQRPIVLTLNDDQQGLGRSFLAGQNLDRVGDRFDAVNRLAPSSRFGPTASAHGHISDYGLSTRGFFSSTII